MESIISKITCLSDVNKLNNQQLIALTEEIRETIKETAYNRGGHLASALGAVDCITALCNVYNFESDKIIFDVGHQSYAYKILASGKERFSTLRTENGESGFPDGGKGECFIGGHAGNSLSAGIGIATARDINKEDYNVICFIGDASFFNGENLEALFANAKKPERLVIVFNDNGMSISKNENGAYKFFAKMASKKTYKTTKSILRKMFGNNAIGRFLRKIRSAFKRSLSPTFAVEATGLKYYGLVDGHNVKQLTQIFAEVKQSGKSAFIHVKTIKGKGYEPAEASAEKYHGVSSGYETSENEFSNAISPLLCEYAKTNDKIVAITAGMKTGTGLSTFASEYPNRFFDVGICEEHAVTVAGGMAVGGLKPVVCIYSTFLQRAVDQIITDVCMQNLPVIFMLDRAGFVGSDGRTHQGLFDLSYLSMIPNLTVLAPKDTLELKEMFEYAIKLNGPVAIRYPNGKCAQISRLAPFSEQNRWEILHDGNAVALFAIGPRLNALGEEIVKQFNGEVALINARSVKPLDEEILSKYSSHKIITMEENIKRGGFGESVLSFYLAKGISPELKIMAVDESFVVHASVASQLKKAGFSKENLIDSIKEMLKK